MQAILLLLLLSTSQEYVAYEATITHYCPCKVCCGQYADGKTATGESAYSGGVAVDPRRIPFGYVVVIGDVNYIADDTGKAMRDNKNIQIDVRVKTHAEARRLGKYKTTIYVYPSGKLNTNKNRKAER